MVLLAAIAQVVTSSFFGQSVGGVAREDVSAILPAGYAFAIWGLIFLVSLVAAAVSLRPSVMGRPALRASGWLIAVAYACNAVWVLLFPQRLFTLAQVVIVVGAVTAVLALVRLQAAADPRDRPVGGLVGTAHGLVAGWLTAATFVGFANTLVSTGLSGSGQAGAVPGIVLLLVATAVAVAVVRSSSRGPVAGTVAYAAAVAWGLIAIVVEQWGVVTSAALTALVLAVAIVGYAAVAVRRHRTA
ncbi:hypothetical protein BJP25_11575 [Actinokineospora bangkokensis]|uniref:Tryptophan-rich sensory protein n=1 Tax=Actinokineospora bangkokensis TaxID=1193682 RepID=A0A1Q9LQX0_9PSEU|nr:hypothetical protein BJP25_11575 [Actinokineospora bangkokensis]